MDKCIKENDKHIEPLIFFSYIPAPAPNIYHIILDMIIEDAYVIISHNKINENYGLLTFEVIRLD